MNLCRIISLIGRWILPPDPFSSYFHGMKVTFDDKTSVVVPDAEALVSYMRNNAYDKSVTNKDFMINFAIRSVKWNDQDIRATCEEDFLNDLIKHEIVVKLEV